MIKIGITGGVGSGKSFITNYIGDNYNAAVYLADDIANKIKEPGQMCYEPVIDLLGKGILDEDGYINKKEMARLIFSDEKLLKGINEIIHPAVKKYVLDEMERLEKEGEKDFFVLEAALLIEENYKKHLDELWYVRVDEETRIERLIETRGYSREKAKGIIDSQLSDEEFLKEADVVIENGGSREETAVQIRKMMERYRG